MYVCKVIIPEVPIHSASLALSSLLSLLSFFFCLLAQCDSRIVSFLTPAVGQVPYREQVMKVVRVPVLGKVVRDAYE